MAKGTVAKALIFKKIIDTFDGAFPYNDGKEIRIPMKENGMEVQIKVTLTCAKDNVIPGGDVALPGENISTLHTSQTNQDLNAPTPKVEITEEEKKNVADLIASLNL